MTTEEKAKAYDEALKRIENLENTTSEEEAVINYIFPQLRENEGERIRKYLIEELKAAKSVGELKFTIPQPTREECIAYLERQKENPKSADSIPADYASDAKCENRWYKVGDSLPDNGRLVLAQDCLGNTLLARYDGEGNWEVSVYDNEDYYCRNTITKWCEIPSERQKEQKPAEWSEEDRQIARKIQDVILGDLKLEIGYLTNEERKKMSDWFTSMFYSHPKSSGNWKPSKDQMKSLQCAIVFLEIRKVSDYDINPLKELYEQLMELM